MQKFPSPSELMRVWRPYLYSDSERTDAYRLSESEFRNHLDTLTDRNQHKDFENFCRKLAERSLCPNLRPQTGPEGGGDGKVDSETYPVGVDIAERWYVGTARSGEESWGFAFSAKKTWKSKVTSDVEGIAETGRDYNRVVFMTSRPARQADRLKLEQELTTKHGIAVTILDREWIIDQVFGHGHKDLAFDYLKAGEHEPDKVAIGPNDFRRQQALGELEVLLGSLGTEGSDRAQSVTVSFDAARLSRELEKPRFETDGRFERAIRLAKKYGANSQHLRAVYEHAWTAVWWHDDIEAMHDLYDEVERIAFTSDNAEHVGRVGNLHQILVSRVVQKLASLEDLDLKIRSTRLNDKLLALSQDPLRPNNALHAETLLVFLDLNMAMLAGKGGGWDQVWTSISGIIDRARGLGEFPAGLIDTVVDALSEFVPDSDAFDRLVEQLADFMAERSKELKAGEVYLTQGERKLGREKPIDAIKWLGRAVVNLSKEESREKQSESLYLLSVGYRGAGLLWAARTTALASSIQYSALSETEGEARVEMIPALKLLRMVSLQLGHVVDALAAHHYLVTLSSQMPLDDASRERVQKGNIEFDHLLACLVTVQPVDEISRLARLPDILERLGLFGSRIMLLHRLGHSDVLRSDGSVPPGTQDDELNRMLEAAAAQPASADLPKRLVIFDDVFDKLRTKVLGVGIEVLSDSSKDGFLQAEAYAAALEGFAATLLNTGVIPYVDRFMIRALRSDVLEDGTVDEGRGDSIDATVPSKWSMTDPVALQAFNNHLIATSVHVMMSMAVVQDPIHTIEELVEKEQIFDRATLFCHSGISRQRLFGAHAGRISDWDHWIKRAYPLADAAPTAPNVGVRRKAFNETNDDEDAGANPMQDKDGSELEDIQSHGDLVVRTVINKKLWDAAIWQGMLYGLSEIDQPPVLGLMFRNKGEGTAIFDEWRERFGKADENDEIRISIIKGIDKSNPFHYRGYITQSLDSIMLGSSKRFINLARMNTMPVNNHRNLEGFLKQLDACGVFFLAPASVDSYGNADLHMDHAILKRKVFPRDAWQIGPNDVDVMGVRLEDDIVIPKGESDAPVEALRRLRQKSGRSP
ncbi:hypothetical protein CO731_01685 [Aminobacter sp. MSH1]|uniref:hypothetical protein n=1 Tax=Aminobacter sp. MSH1 TaxID=374606 RepID=UPI000D505614|nr:hypothetical protein [Aminobacter sp. MSH1]AWC22229.1 hypothetical protein CO731_01685 [Aminobacter sp. MSH1]